MLFIQQKQLTKYKMSSFTDPAEFHKFMVDSIMSIHNEMAGMKLMILNMYTGFSPLITQAANRATGTFQEVS